MLLRWNYQKVGNRPGSQKSPNRARLNVMELEQRNPPSSLAALGSAGVNLWPVHRDQWDDWPSSLIANSEPDVLSDLPVVNVLASKLPTSHGDDQLNYVEIDFSSFLNGVPSGQPLNKFDELELAPMDVGCCEGSHAHERDLVNTAKLAGNVQFVSLGGGIHTQDQDARVIKSAAPGTNNVNIIPPTHTRAGNGWVSAYSGRAFEDTNFPRGRQDLIDSRLGTPATAPYRAGAVYTTQKLVTGIIAAPAPIFEVTAKASITIGPNGPGGAAPTSWSGNGSEYSIRKVAGAGQGGRTDEALSAIRIVDPMIFLYVRPGDQFIFSHNWNGELNMQFPDPVANHYRGTATFSGSMETEFASFAWSVTLDESGGVDTNFQFSPSLGIDGVTFGQAVKNGFSFAGGRYSYAGPPINFVVTVPADYQGDTVTFTDSFGATLQAQGTGGEPCRRLESRHDPLNGFGPAHPGRDVTGAAKMANICGL